MYRHLHVFLAAVVLGLALGAACGPDSGPVPGAVASPGSPSRTLEPPAPPAATSAEADRPGGLPEGVSPGRLQVLKVDGEQPREELELPLEHTAVAIEVSGFVARARIEQRYGNPFTEPIEAVYTFPLPHDAAVDEMVMRIGERTIRGVVKEREEARRIYQEARDQGQRASLLEQERPNIFTQSVANIMPGDQITITIAYVDVLQYSEGAYELVFPMVVGPRYIPGTVATGHQGTGYAVDTDQVPDASRITPPVLKPGQRSGHDIALAVDLDAGLAIRGLRSPSHAIDVWDESANRARVAIHPSDTIPNKDFVLRYEVAGEAPQVAVIPHHDERGGFFTLLVQPQREVRAEEVIPRELVFILDTSGSMRGFPLAASKAAMKRLLAGMRPGDTFNVVRFAGDTGTLWPRPMPYTDDNARAAWSYVEAMRGAGGTEMRRGVVEALAQPAGEGMLRIAFLLTDGYVGNDAQILDAIHQSRRGARVFTLGVGSSVNRSLLDRAALVGRGEAYFVRPDEDTAAVTERFFHRVDRPALAYVQIDWGDLDVRETYPRRIPDLWAGQPIRIHGRYTEGGQETLLISGQVGSEAYQQEVTVQLPRNHAANAAMASVWARHKVKELMLGLVGSGDQAEVQAEVTRLGLEFRLMTRWTSFVAVEEKTVNVDGTPQTVVQPVELPEGVTYEGVFGDDGFSVADERARIKRSVQGLISGGAGGRAYEERSIRSAAPQRRVPIPDPTPDEPEPIREPEKQAGFRVELETVAARGGLRQADAVRVLRGSLGDLSDAYRARLATSPGLSGRLDLQLTIAADGTVGAVVFSSGSLADEVLQDALRKVLLQLRFPAVAGGGEAAVLIRLVLST